MLSNPFGREKREAARVPVSMQVEETSGDRPLGFGYARDISERGLAVEAKALLPGARVPAPGAEVRMRFKLPKSNVVVTVYGRVVRVDGASPAPRIAFEFVSLDPDFAEAIRQFVELRARPL